MSFLDSLGTLFEGAKNTLGINDAWHDIASVWSSGDHNALYNLGATLGIGIGTYENASVNTGKDIIGAVPATGSAIWQHSGGAAIDAAQQAVHLTTGIHAFANTLTNYPGGAVSGVLNKLGNPLIGASPGAFLANVGLDALTGFQSDKSWADPGQSPTDYAKQAWGSTVGGEQWGGFSAGQADWISAVGVANVASSAGMPLAANSASFGLSNNPMNWSKEQRDAVFGSGINQKASGSADLFLGTVLDPTNVLPVVGKAGRAVVAGKYIVDNAPKGFLRGAWQINREQAAKMMDEGLTDPESNFGAMYSWFAKSDEAAILNSPIARRSGNASAIAAVMGPTQTVDEARNAWALLTRTGTEEELQQATSNLLSSVAARGENSKAHEYLLQTLASGHQMPLAEDGIRLADSNTASMFQAHLTEAMKDTESSFTRAYQQAVNDVLNLPVPLVEQSVGSKAFLKYNEAMASRRAGQFGGLIPGTADPMLTFMQKSSLHPVLTIANFFTKDRTSGYINFHHSDSVNEVGALINDIDRVTNGGMRSTGEGRAWINKYIEATSTQDRLKVTQALEERGFELLGAKHGLGSASGEFMDSAISPQAAAQELYRQFSERRGTAMQTYKDQGFLSWITQDGVSTVAKVPLLERQGANILPLADFGQVNKAIANHGADAIMANLRGAADLGQKGLNVINDIFKTSVLLRIGYPIRNLTEAFASMFVRGMLGASVLATDPAAAKIWANGIRQRGNRMVDRYGVWNGTRDDLDVAQQDLTRVEAEVTARENMARGVQAALEQATDRLKPDDIALLQQYRDGQLTSRIAIAKAQAIMHRVEMIAELRGATTHARTYHATTAANFRNIDGDWIDTTPSAGVAAAHADVAGHDYINWETAGERVKGIPNDFAPRPGEATAPRPPLPQRGTIANRHKAMLDQVGEALDRGDLVQYTRGNSFQNLTRQQYERMVAQGYKRGNERLVFRARPLDSQPQALPIISYGKELDLTRWAQMPDDLREQIVGKGPGGWGSTKAWNDPEVAQILAKYAKDNGYGRMILPDKGWGQTVRILKDHVDGYGGRGMRAVQDRNVADLVDEARTHALGQISPISIERTRAQRVDARYYLRSNAAFTHTQALRGVPVHYEYSQAYVQDMVDRGGRNAIRQVIDDLATARAKAEGARTQLAQVRQRYTNLSKPMRSGTDDWIIETAHGPVTVRGAFGGAAGDSMARATHGDANYDHLIGDGSGYFANSIPNAVNTTVKPGDPRYFEAWSNILNMHWRDPSARTVVDQATQELSGIDPVVKRLLDGQHPEEVIRYLRDTPEGQRYADEIGWHVSGPESIDEAVHTLQQSIRLYLPDEEIRSLFRQGKVDPEALSARYGGSPDLHELNGLLVPQSREYADYQKALGTMRTMQRKVFHAIGALPETTFARHPLFRAVYKQEMEKSIPRAVAEKGRQLTLDEVNAVVVHSQERARKVVNQTLFTINRRTGAAQSLQLLIPFYAAWENTLRRWGGFAAHDTEGLVRLGSSINRGLNNANLIDSTTGQPIKLSDVTDPTKVNMLLPFSPDKLPGGLKEFDAQVPLGSMDVLFQGQPLNPGIGPFVALPMLEVMKRQPRAEQILDWAFPAGQVRDATDLFIPATLKRLKSKVFEDQSFMNDANRIAMHEYIAYANGERPDMPKWSEIEQKTQQFYSLKALTNAVAPASITYTNDVNYYANEYRSMQKLYGQDADAKFLELHPEAFVVMEPLSNNPTGVRASYGTVDNLKNYSDLAALAAGTDPEMVGFLGNFGQGAYNPSDFSQAAYNWETDNAAVTGADAFRTKKNPMQIWNDGLVHKGWIQYRQMMDMLAGEMTSQGIDPATPGGLKVMKSIRPMIAQSIREGNQAWYDAYGSSDSSKYDKRANFLEAMVTDKTFMNDHASDGLTQSIAYFLQVRSKMAEDLLAADQTPNGSRRIGAKSNFAANQAYQAQIETLKQQNLAFADFYDRYFANDPVVL